ncbi:MAG TPA: YicC/YloC family endoribonuclease [Geobacteraceae bacterium]|nr:YicC/YloC family endoribonuclease [Geobacteraceae bacterium]
MIKSMTGYGKHEVTLEHGRIIAEIRAVNHRYGEVFVKLPRSLLSLENDVRKCIAERLKRGKIEVYVQFEGVAGAGGTPAINIPLAKAYYDAFVKLKDSLGLYDPVPLSLIASQKDLLISEESGESYDSVRGALIDAVRMAVDHLDAMRLREGRALLEDLRPRRLLLSALLTRVTERSPNAVAENAARFKARVMQLTGDNGIDEGRLVQEIALMADRWDINEELVRFRSHLKQFDETMEMDEPIGRKLDFLIQELNREVNTIGSKANDAEITSIIVELKSELEKIREQVQNIE